MAHRTPLLVAAAVLGYLASAWPTLPSMVDDAYVSARYAQMLATGEGLRFNAGLPPVEGYTDFAWVLWMAPGTILPLHYSAWATGWGLLFGALAVILAALALPAGPWRLAPAVTLAALPHFAIAATNGLETSQFVALLLLAVVGLGGSAPWTGLVAGGLYLVRPEGLLAGGILALVAARRARSPRPLLAAAAVVLPYFLARYAWFGTLVPNTWAAQRRGGWGQVWSMNADYLLDSLPVWVGVLPALLLVAVVAVRRRDADLALLLTLALALAAVALRVFNWMPGLRLLLPSLALLFVATGRALAALSPDAPRLTRALALVGAGWLAWLTFGPARSFATTYDVVNTVLPGGGGERLGRAIAAAAPPGTWLLIRDAGVVPYYAGTAVNVVDIHPYSLTDPALTGRTFDLEHVLGREVSVLVTTAHDPEDATMYTEERRLLADPRVRGRLTRGPHVEQHARRWFTPWTRPDVRLPPYE